jgi:diadenosine tetraphosphate (Ap4A) HIT family hydrolase
VRSANARRKGATELPSRTTFESLTIRALEELGGEAYRHAIRDRAIELARFTSDQLAVPAPPSKRGQYPNQVEYQLPWALSHLQAAGRVERVRPSVWRLTGACPFCLRIGQGPVRSESALAVSLPDAYPVTPGHLLVMPRRHEPDFFALTQKEQESTWELLRRERDALAREYATDAFNVGLNAGAPAGQTVSHAHLHLIPRRPGDVPDPRGGFRWVTPERAPYWDR